MTGVAVQLAKEEKQHGKRASRRQRSECPDEQWVGHDKTEVC